MRPAIAFAPLAAIALAACPVGARSRDHPGPAMVVLWRLPDGAIQPQVALDDRGVVHMIYFRATGQAGNLFYVRRAPGQPASAPMRVNSEPDSAGAVGTVRAAQLAIGREGRVHVVWNGLGPIAPNGYPTAYEAYARLNDAGTAFGPQRNLVTWARGLDGGGSVAAARDGSVYVTWHAMASATNEAGRAVFVAISRDDGRTFAREKQANPEPTGACGCCGMRALVGPAGGLYVLYRASGGGTNRDTMLLVSRDRGATFAERVLDRWQTGTCPMSTYSLAAGGGSIIAAWETGDRVRTAPLRADGSQLASPVSPPGTMQKHPFVASGAGGRTLLVWTEGTGWQRGGALAWQLTGPAGSVLDSGRKADVVPVWGLASAYTRPDGGFVIVY